MPEPFSLNVDKRCHECEVAPADLEVLYHRGIEILKQKAHLQKRMRGGTLKVFFVSDEEIRQLNRNYRDQDKPTDVISLSYLEGSPFPGQDMIGEIFISVDTTQRQAKKHGLRVQEEAAYLFVHGFLHIFGYDHEKPAEEEVMFALQDEIVESDKWRILTEDLET